MGLSAPRKRAKISHDPNNTKWTRATTKFGQRMLESQGWTPGDFLGAKNAAHAAHYTTANAFHIRIAVKDDNLGLGAEPGRSQQEAPTTGLDMFQDVLGRLNGKSEAQLVTQHKTRNQLRGSIFVEQRWGKLSFVNGGLLVGYEIQALSKGSSSNASQGEQAPHIEGKATSIVVMEDEKACSSTSKCKKHRASKNGTAVQKDDSEGLSGIQQPGGQRLPQDTDGIQSTQDKAQRKAEKAARKLRRQMKRDKKHALQAGDPAAHLIPSPGPASSQLVGKLEAAKEGPAREGKISSPEDKTFPVVGGSRQAVRQRYIQQKKLSMMDSKALNEILMIKA